MMKVLQVIPELNVGGVETGTVDFARYLVNQGHKSIVVSNGGHLVELLEASGTKHYILPVHKKSLWNMIKTVKALRWIIRKENIDIVHARSRVPAWISFFACHKTKAAFITTCHGYYKNRFLSQVMGWAKLIIVPSQVIGWHMINAFGVSSGSIRCIPRSVDLKKFNKIRRINKDPSECIISMIGRITPIKGHIYFIKSMAKVIRALPYTKIWIIGDVPQKKEPNKRELEALIRRLGMEDHVEFLGSRSDIPELLSKTDVLVFSSIYPESFGRVILEAQAINVPVVATKVGGVLDIIDDGKTGLLVLPKDVDAMAGAVVRLLKDKNLVERLTKEAKKKLKEKFTLEQMASSTIDVYRELLSSLNILIIKLSSVGDVVLITASLKLIRKKYPNARIYCLVGKESRKILQKCPYLDGLIVYDNRDKSLGKFLKLTHKLRKYRFDKIIDFQNSRKSHLISFLSFAKESYGFNRKWGFFLTHPLKEYRNDISAVPHQYQLLNMLGINSKGTTYLDLWPSRKDNQYAKDLLESEWLGDDPNIVGLNISASKKWVTKNWSVEYISKLCDLLSKDNIRVMLTGQEKDHNAAQKILSLTKAKPANFVGKTDILQLAALIKRCKVFITTDSAPMHVAAAVQTPFIALFGPTESSRHIPPAKNFIILEKKPPCAPCYVGQYCRTITHSCMNDISPEDVAGKIDELIALK